MDTIRNNPVVSTIVIIIVLILVIFIIWRLHKLYKKNKLVTPMLWKPIARVGPIIDNKLEDSNKKKYFSSTKANDQDIVPDIGNLKSDKFILRWSNTSLPKSKTMEYTYSIWFKIDDWNTNYGMPKNLFMRGKPLSTGSITGFSCNPGVWLHPVTNNLMIRVDTLANVPDLMKSARNMETNAMNHMMTMPYSSLPVIRQEGSIEYPTPTFQNSIGTNDVILLLNKMEDMLSTYEKKRLLAQLSHQTGKQYNSIADLQNAVNQDTYGRNALNTSILRETIHQFTKKRYPGMINESFMPELACDVQNIPSQSWVNLTITLFNRTLDVFINGKLHRSCTLKGIPRMDSHNEGDMYLCYSPLYGNDTNGPVSFDGSITRFKYWPRTLNAHEIYDYYEQGATHLLSRFKDMLPNVKFQFAVNTGSKTYGGTT